MASSKTLLVLTIIAFIATTVNSVPYNADNNVSKFGQSNNNLIVGQREYNDKLVYQESISIKASLIGTKVIHEQVFNATKDHVITQIVALDQVNDGTGASVVVTAGGPGRDNAKLRFKSQRFHGIYFIVQIYAKPKYLG